MKTLITSILLATITASSSVLAATPQDLSGLDAAIQMKSDASQIIGKLSKGYNTCDDNAFGRISEAYKHPELIAKALQCKVQVHDRAIQEAQDLTGQVFSGSKTTIIKDLTAYVDSVIAEASAKLEI